MARLPLISVRITSEPSSQPWHRTILSPLLQASTMDAKSRRPKGRDNTVSALNVAIDALNLAKEIASIAPAKAVFGTVSIILTTIKVSFLFFVGRLSIAD